MDESEFEQLNESAESFNNDDDNENNNKENFDKKKNNMYMNDDADGEDEFGNDDEY